MVIFKDFSEFHAFYKELREKDIECKLYGQSKKYFTGAPRDYHEPNTFKVTVVALTTLGTFYSSERANLRNNDQVCNLEALFDSLPVTETKVSIRDSSVILG